MRRMLIWLLFRFCGDSWKGTTCGKRCLCLPIEKGAIDETEKDIIDVEELHQKLSDCINPLAIEAAGRVLYYDAGANAFILAMHTTSPEKTHEATQLAWDSIPEELKAEMRETKIGFVGKQI